jgi:hypothetical protein
MKLEFGDERGGCDSEEMEGAVVVCALMHALAGTCVLPWLLLLNLAMFRVWRCLSAPRRT